MTAPSARPSRARDGSAADTAEVDLSAADLAADQAAVLAVERDAAGWSAERLDREAGLSRSYVWGLSNGVERLSESTSRRLAEALARGQAAVQGRTATSVDVAVLDLRLQRAAPGLRRWARRKPYSLRRQRVYDEAARRLDEPRPPTPGEALEMGRVLAALEPSRPTDITTIGESP
jgi:hypothetical protein